MSKHKLTDAEIYRLWDLHKLGVPNTKVATELCVSERTDRYHLGILEPEPGLGVFRSLSDSEELRKGMIDDLLDKLILILSRKLREARRCPRTPREASYLKSTDNRDLLIILYAVDPWVKISTIWPDFDRRGVICSRG